MYVRDLMTPAPITVPPSTPVADAKALMAKSEIRHLLVVENGSLLGILTDRDIRLNLPSPATTLSVWEINALLARLAVREVMSHSVMVVDGDRPLAEAAQLLLDHTIGAVAYDEGGRRHRSVNGSDVLH